MKFMVMRWVVGLALALAAQSSMALVIVGLGGVVANTTVAQTNSGQYSYQYSVQFDQGMLQDPTLKFLMVDIPYFSDDQLQDITSPAGWQASINPQNLFGYPDSGALQWTDSNLSGLASQIAEASNGLVTISGFGFLSPYSPVEAPMLVISSLGSQTIDPLIPGSPGALNAGLSPTPLPASVWLLAGGLVLLAWVLRRKPVYPAAS